MAVWALAEAQKDPELRSPLYDEKLHDGVSILLNTYKSGTPGRWSTRRDQSGSIEGLFGLTMQISIFSRKRQSCRPLKLLSGTVAPRELADVIVNNNRLVDKEISSKD